MTFPVGDGDGSDDDIDGVLLVPQLAGQPVRRHRPVGIRGGQPQVVGAAPCLAAQDRFDADRPGHPDVCGVDGDRLNKRGGGRHQARTAVRAAVQDDDYPYRNRPEQQLLQRPATPGTPAGAVPRCARARRRPRPRSHEPRPPRNRRCGRLLGPRTRVDVEQEVVLDMLDETHQATRLGGCCQNRMDEVTGLRVVGDDVPPVDRDQGAASRDRLAGKGNHRIEVFDRRSSRAAPTAPPDRRFRPATPAAAAAVLCVRAGGRRAGQPLGPPRRPTRRSRADGHSALPAER